jgi:hypothetical protein
LFTRLVWGAKLMHGAIYLSEAYKKPGCGTNFKQLELDIVPLSYFTSTAIKVLYKHT